MPQETDEALPRPDAIITDRLRSYRAALRELGGTGRHQAGRWLNNRAENSHLPFRRREGVSEPRGVEMEL